jgi:hypothetical protein
MVSWWLAINNPNNHLPLFKSKFFKTKFLLLLLLFLKKKSIFWHVYSNIIFAMSEISNVSIKNTSVIFFLMCYFGTSEISDVSFW